METIGWDSNEHRTNKSAYVKKQDGTIQWDEFELSRRELRQMIDQGETWNE